jgi:AraC-like DNA-binding protein
MQIASNRKKDGFEGQKAVVIPRQILAKQCAKNGIISALYITDIGFYPKARFHYRERLSGADQHILISCIEGRGQLKIKKKHYSIEPGDFFIIPAHTGHTYIADEHDPWTIYWIHFKGVNSGPIVELIMKQFQNTHKGFLQYNEERIHLFTQIYAHLERGYSNDNLLYANMCLWQYLNSFSFSDKFNNSSQPETFNAIECSIEYMRNHIEEMLTLQDVAKAVNLSSSHFSFLFKKETGFPPMEYFNHLKIQKACQFLLFTKLRIKEISYKLGMEDPYYFSRLFTKIMGLSPIEYREKKVH